MSFKPYTPLQILGRTRCNVIFQRLDDIRRSKPTPQVMIQPYNPRFKPCTPLYILGRTLCNVAIQITDEIRRTKPTPQVNTQP